MQTLYELLSTANRQELTELLIAEIFAGNVYRERICNDVESLYKMLEISQPEENGLILFGFKQEGEIVVRVVEMLNNNIGKPIQIISQPIAEYILSHGGSADPLMGRFLGMSVEMGGLEADDRLLFLVQVIAIVWRDDFSDDQKRIESDVEPFLQEWFAWARKDELKKISSYFGREYLLTPDREWCCSEQGHSRRITWLAVED